MQLRTMIIIPKFKQQRKIQTIREKFDSLAKDTQPHIILMHPFDLQTRQKFLRENIEKRIKHLKPFKMKFSKISKQDGYYLHLDISAGVEKIKELHNVLYSNNLGTIMGERVEYTPYMVIGKFKSVVDMDKAYKELKETKFDYEAYVDAIYVENIDNKNKTTFEFSVKI